MGRGKTRRTRINAVAVRLGVPRLRKTRRHEDKFTHEFADTARQITTTLGNESKAAARRSSREKYRESQARGRYIICRVCAHTVAGGNGHSTHRLLRARARATLRRRPRYAGSTRFAMLGACTVMPRTRRQRALRQIAPAAVETNFGRRGSGQE